AAGPLRRMTPMPARPGAVAIATIVSSRANILPRRARRDDDRLHLPVALALRGDLGIERHLHVDDAARVGIERAQFLRGLGRLGLVDQKLRHLLQFEILAAAEVLAVDDDA